MFLKGLLSLGFAKAFFLGFCSAFLCWLFWPLKGPYALYSFPASSEQIRESLDGWLGVWVKQWATNGQKRSCLLTCWVVILAYFGNYDHSKILKYCRISANIKIFWMKDSSVLSTKAFLNFQTTSIYLHQILVAQGGWKRQELILKQQPEKTKAYVEAWQIRSPFRHAPQGDQEFGGLECNINTKKIKKPTNNFLFWGVKHQ